MIMLTYTNVTYRDCPLASDSSDTSQTITNSCQRQILPLFLLKKKIARNSSDAIDHDSKQFTLVKPIFQTHNLSTLCLFIIISIHTTPEWSCNGYDEILVICENKE